MEWNLEFCNQNIKLCVSLYLYLYFVCFLLCLCVVCSFSFYSFPFFFKEKYEKCGFYVFHLKMHNLFWAGQYGFCLFFVSFYENKNFLTFLKKRFCDTICFLTHAYIILACIILSSACLCYFISQY